MAYADLVDSGKTLFIVSRDARLIHFRVRDVPVLAGPGKGVRGLKLEDRDEVLGAMQLMELKAAPTTPPTTPMIMIGKYSFTLIGLL